MTILIGPALVLIVLASSLIAGIAKDGTPFTRSFWSS
jgi:hypothetical protein